MGPEHRLIVYGTLAPGKSNHAQMQGMVGTWTPGIVHGYFRDSGVGSGGRYPGLIPDPRGPALSILVFTSVDLPAHWARLDAFEGKDYHRVIVEAEMDRVATPASIYAVGLQV